MVKPYAGIHTVLYALFAANEKLDRDAMRRQVELCKQAGVDGITVLGLATEVSKLSFEERCNVILWAAEDVAQVLPFSVTIAGNSVAEQVALIQVAEQAGADWLILQPPLSGSYPSAVYLDFFYRVAASTRRPVAIQNAPAYLGRGLTYAELLSLHAASPNICILKAECIAAEMSELVKHAANRMTVLNGRGGLELPAVLTAGADGFIIAPDMVDYAVKAYAHWKAGRFNEAEAVYREALPAIGFVMRSIEHLITYGKRLFGQRAGIAIFDRAPCLPCDVAEFRSMVDLAISAGKFGRR